MLPYKTLIQLNRDLQTPLYVQLCSSFISLISSGMLQASDALPSTRKLSELIEVNRNTVKLAYEELMKQGWAEAIERRGVFVVPRLPKVARHGAGARQTAAEPERASFLWDNPFKESLPPENYQRHILRIDDGFPDVRLTPVDLLMREYRSISRRFYGKNFLKYGPPKGSGNLRSALARYLSDTRGLVSDPENILITKGSQMGIYLASQLLLRPTDKIAVGLSNYNSADEIFRYSGAELLRIPVDESGMDIDALEARLERECIRAVYIIPHHHFPTTVTMSNERRLRLLALAREYRFAIIEDDYDFDFHYSSQAYVPLAGIDNSNQVIYIGSITKTFAPALRIGFLISGPEFVDACTSLRQLIDKQGDSLLEEAFASLYDNGEMERHFRKCLMIYKQRRDVFCEQLRNDFGDVISFTPPEGGLAIWSLFNRDIDLKALSRRAFKNGLQIADGSFYINESFTPNGLRLGFASLDEKEIAQALQLLRSAL